jgi:hypothetical protein
MRGDYLTRVGSRPRHAPAGEDCHDSDGTPARLFLCQGGRAQVLICSHCDRGQMYCTEGCARQARRRSQRQAGRRYQMSLRGRINHAERSRRHRVRKNNVTHQSSPRDRRDGLLSVDQAVAMTEQLSRNGAGRPQWHCHRCGRRCPQLVRRDFLQRCQGPWNNRRGRRHDHPP